MKPTPDDKTTWGPGPWQDEPDRAEWRHAGLPCLIRRGPTGVWCGYVAVPPGHPAHGQGYDEVDVEVHGGLTYASTCDGNENTGICHVPQPGEPADVWWFGFDCGHAWDLSPFVDAVARLSRIAGTWTYRNLAYVATETERLADQLVDLAAVQAT